MPEINRKSLAILRVLDSVGFPLGAGAIAGSLKDYGIELTERAVRYHLDRLDAAGFTVSRGRRGREITELGRREVAQAQVADKVGLVFARLDALAYQMKFDIGTGQGTVVVNVSHIPLKNAKRALAVMRRPLTSRFCTCRRIAVLKPGRRIGSHAIPDDMLGVATVCGVTINGILFSQGIPVHSVFGGLLAVEGHEPTRFVDLVHYGSTSIDPLEIFIKSGATSCVQAAARGTGIVGASFREFPAVAREHVCDLVEQARKWGLRGVLAIGSPAQPVAEAQVGLGRCGMIVCAGLNAIAAVEESGIPTTNRAMEAIMDYSQLVDIEEVRLP